MDEHETPPDIDALWEYGDPAASEARFRAALRSARGDARLELLTQVARTHSLRGQLAEAHALLDEVEPQLAGAGARPRLRYLLERGRAHNSAGDRAAARPLFVEAWEQGRAAGQEGLAVDAAHMVAITLGGTPDALAWTERALAVARPSHDPKARALLPALLNNSAWDLHDQGRPGEALPRFEEARAAWEARGGPQQVRAARWAVARCLRSLGRHEQALAAQRAMEAEDDAAGAVDGYVLEEIAENLAALGQEDAARPYFGAAADALGADAWFAANEPARLASLVARAAPVAAISQRSGKPR